MKLLQKVLSGTVIFGLSSVALAGSFDFVNEAAGNEGGAEGESFLSSDGVTTVTTTSSNDSNGQIDSAAYLDDLSSGRPGGLGVCSSGLVDDGNPETRNDCRDSSDDNVSGDDTVETLILTFGEPVTITSIMFRDENHFNDRWLDGDVLAVVVDNVALPNQTLDAVWNGAITGTVFEFTYVNRNFYITSITHGVPEPATLALLGLGMLGAGAARRRISK